MEGAEVPITTDGQGLPPPALDAAALRDLHLRMVGAVMAGGGLDRIAEIAGNELRAPVAIVVPRLGDALHPPHGGGAAVQGRLRRYVRERVAERPTEVPEAVAAEVPISSGEDMLGAAMMLRGKLGASAADAHDVLGVVAIAALTELAVADVREETEQALRSSLIDLIRGNPDLDEEDVLRRAYRVGSDLSRGAVAFCAEMTSDRPRYVMALVTERQPQALIEHLDDRVYALLPPAADEDPAKASLATARQIADAVAPYATAAFSSFCSRPQSFHRAIQEAELVLDVLRHGADTKDVDSDTYRLLARTLASHPDEVVRFYEDTVAPLVRYDEQYGTDLVGTVEAYLAHNCNMNATAAGMYAHRHTIAYRLDRVRDLTGLEPNVSEDRERLGLGLKSYRLLAPQVKR